MPEEPQQKRHAIPIFQQLVLVSSILFLLLAGPAYNYIYNAFSTEEADTPSQTAAVTPLSTAATENASAATFESISLTAKAAFVLDVENETVLFEKAASESVPIASITKLMTVMLAHELLSSDSAVVIDKTAVLQDGVSSFLVDEKFSRQTLSDLVLLSSSNDGAYALSVAAGSILDNTAPAEAFVKAMNIRATEIGMTDTVFQNPSGLDTSSTEASNFATAADVATLLSYILVQYPELLEITTADQEVFASESGITHNSANTNYYLDELPGLIGSKTGYTELAGGNLAIAFMAGLNRPVVVVALGSTRHDRFTDVIALSQATLHALHNLE